MPTVLIVYASRHGSTEGIAARIGDTLLASGLDVVIQPARDMPTPAGVDACIVGSAVYMGNWLPDGIEYLERYAVDLGNRPVWLFSSGPLPGSTRETAEDATDEFGGALGPADGPGSGGRKRIVELGERIHAREHVIFNGAFDPTDSPKTLAERFVRWVPGARNILPAGDFRDWEEIAHWAREVAQEIREPAPVG